jgi:putative transposase
MSQVVSPSSKRSYGLARVSRLWDLCRSALYAQRARAQRPPAPQRRGRRLVPDERVLDAIRAALVETPWVGEGYRKVWAALRARSVRVSKGRVLSLMRRHNLLAPQRAGNAHGPAAHDGTIITELPDQMWGIDATTTLTRYEGAISVFVMVDHATAECTGLHAAHRGTRLEAIETLKQGIHEIYGGYSAAIANSLAMRHDHGSPFVSDLFQRELSFLGIFSSPAYVREPEGNGCAERFIRTLKEQLLWLQRFDGLDDLQRALADFKQRYNHHWRIERHGFLSPAEQRKRLLASTREAA